MKIYFNEAFVETKRETNDLWVKGDNGDMLYAFFEGVDLSDPNIYTRLIIQWANGQATNELPMNKSFDKKSAYVTLPILKAGETKFTIRIYENGVLNHTAIFTRVVKESIDASDDTNISPDEYLGLLNAIETNTTNIANNVTAIANKVNKTDEANKAYGTNTEGHQTTINYSNNVLDQKESLILRGRDGRAKVNNPLLNKEIANKEYVDHAITNSENETEDKLNGKANKDYVDGKIANSEAETEDKLANLEAETENKVGYLEEKTEYKLNGKADKTFVNPAFKDVEVAKNTINGTYTFTFTKLDNTTKEVQIDTPEEFIIDYNKPPYLEGNNLIITFVGGSTISIDMSTLVKYNTFENTTTITLTEDSNHKVTATLNDGSVKLSHLNTEVISKINNNTTNIAKNKQDINDLQSEKVDKISGKGLSTNDFTDVLKNKLNGIETGAQKNPNFKTINGKDIVGTGNIQIQGGGSSSGYEPDGVTIVLNNSNELEVSKDLEVEWTNVVNKPTFSTVATTGSYNDLSGKPDLTTKLDKNFATLPNQASPLLTDVLVINRGTVAQKTTLGNLLAQVDAEIFVVVASLPTTGVVNKIYLLPKGTPESQDGYDEYIWVNNAWELIGSIALDLSNFYNITQIDGMLSGYVAKEVGKGLSDNNYTNTDKQSVEKIPTIEQDILDLESDKGLSVETWNTATKTLALSDSNRLFICTGDLDQTVIVPRNASVPFPIGTMITFLLESTYAVKFIGASIGGSGVTLTSMDSLVELKTQFAMASLIKTHTNTWQLVGALE